MLVWLPDGELVVLYPEREETLDTLPPVNMLVVEVCVEVELGAELAVEIDVRSDRDVVIEFKNVDEFNDEGTVKIEFVDDPDVEMDVLSEEVPVAPLVKLLDTELADEPLLREEELVPPATRLFDEDVKGTLVEVPLERRSVEVALGASKLKEDKLVLPMLRPLEDRLE